MTDHTGLAGHTGSTQVVNKMQYCYSPEFNMAVACEIFSQQENKCKNNSKYFSLSWKFFVFFGKLKIEMFSDFFFKVFF